MAYFHATSACDPSLQFSVNYDLRPDRNPYVFPVPAGDPGLQPKPAIKTALALFRIACFSIVWTLIFAFGSAVLIGAFAGVYISAALSTGMQPDLTSPVFGAVSTILPMLLGAIGFVLGVLGILPGTRRIRRSIHTGG